MARRAAGQRNDGDNRGRRSRSSEAIMSKVWSRFGRMLDNPEFDLEELIAAVFDEFRQGKPSDEIKDKINKDYGDKLPHALNREDPYDLIRYAAAKGRINFVPTTKPDL